MTQYSFGLGHLYGVRTDVANSTPREFGVLQECSLDFDTPVQLLYGQNIYPVAGGRKKSKMSGKAKFAQINGRLFNDLFFAGTPTVAQLQVINGEAGTPVTNVRTVTQSATWVDDLGVVGTSGALAGRRFTKVASAPATGQYSVAAGVYTFAAADSNPPVAISYTYTVAAPADPVNRLSVPNLVMTSPPTLQLVWHESFLSKDIVIKCPNVIAEKLAWPIKQEDFLVSELDFQILDNGSGTMFDVTMAE